MAHLNVKLLHGKKLGAMTGIAVEVSRDNEHLLRYRYSGLLHPFIGQLD